MKLFKRLISLIFVFIICLTSIACNNKKTDLPDYEASINDYEYIINSWYSPKSTLEQYQLYKDANFNWIILQGDNVNADPSAHFDLCDELGIKAYLDLNNNLTSITTSSKYLKYSSYKGIYAYDEPFFEDTFTNGTVHCGINSIANYLEGFEMANEGKDFIVNLNPIYSQAIIEQTSNKGGYKAYVDEYCKLILNNISSGDKWLACDSYPLKTSGLYTGWLENLEYYSVAKQNYLAEGVKVKTNMMFQSMPFASSWNVIPNYAMLSLQFYTCLAFGYDSVTYFCYATPRISDDFRESQFALVDRNGIPTNIYYDAKQLNSEILSFDHYFMTFNNWQGICPIVAEGSSDKANSSFNGISMPLTLSSLGGIKNVTADGDILIGHVKDEKGNSAYWVVNYDEESLSKGNKINVDIEFKNDYNQTYQFIKGEKKAVAISNESINLSLESGQGVFIIPYHD